METKILLCCINPEVDIKKINEFFIYKVFKEHAIVKNIKIFNRDVLLKAFIEIDADSIDQCIKMTHMQQCDLGKLKVYVSHKNNITFDKDLKTIISQSGYLKTSTSQVESQNQKNFHFNTFSDRFQQKSENKKSSKISNLKFSNVSQSFEDLNEIFNDNMYIDYKNIKSVTDINSKLPELVKYYPVSLENINTNKSPVSKEAETSKVLIVNRINVDKINCFMIMNIFGCFGNVKKVLLNLKGSFVLVEMENEEYALLTIKHLNNTMFFGSNIKVKCSKYNTISLKSIEKEKNPDVQFLRGHYKYFRYKEGLHIKVNKPSNLLHITSISDQFTSYLLCQLISQIHEPGKIVKLNKNEDTANMFLVEFEQIYEAVEVLSVFHNKKIEGKLMKISFSHTNINEIN